MYYTIGENELNDIDIYSLMEDDEGNLFISSDNGLYRYQNGTFFHYPRNENQTESSLFFLVKTTQGQLFCSNLKGQVFKVGNNSIELFYQIPKTDLISIPYLLTDSQGNLVVISKNIITLNSKGEKVSKIDSFSFVNKTIEGKIIVGKDLKSYHQLHGKTFYSLPNCDGKSDVVNQINQRLAPKSYQNLFIENNKSSAIDNPINSLYELNKKSFITRLRNGGIQEYHIQFDTVTPGKVLFPDTYISSFNKGKNNLYLGTLKQGIRIVPNINFVQLKHNYPSRSIIDFNFNSGNYLLNIRKEGLVDYDFEKEAGRLIAPNSNTKVLSEKGVILNKSKYPNVLFDFKDVPAIKDIAKVDSKTVLLASSVGLLQINSSSKTNFIDWKESSFEKPNYFECEAIKDRCTAVEFDSINGIIYLSTQSQLLKVSKNGVSEIKVSQQPIIATDLILRNGKLYIASKQNGVLLYSDGKTTTFYNSENGLSNNWVRKIAFHNNSLFVLNKNFFQQIDLNSGKITPLNKPEGIIGFINTFQVYDNELWVLTDNSNLISIPLNDLNLTSSQLEFQIDSVCVNKMRVDFEQKGHFSYNKNNIQLYTHITNDAYREHTKISYRLVGYEDDWNQLHHKSSEIEYKKLPVGEYELLVSAEYGGSVVNYSYSFVIQSPFWSKAWFILLCVITGLLIVTFYYRYRMKQQRKKAQKKLLEQQISNDLTEAKLTALRSQMNPHFIFNALNSIQNLILKKDVHTSYDYIVLFSKLVRNTLNYSEKEFISIEEEVSFLDIYLKLEKLRFGKDFSYSIESNGIENIEVPPLLIQPFIENALLHGLLNKKGKKELSIQFEMNNNQLHCEVIDNGIGRKRAKEINERQGVNRKSFALNAIQKRLSIMEDRFGTEIGYTIEDLFENNQSTGTKVKIIVPYN